MIFAYDCRNLTDIDYLSFALQIEYLEAQYYSLAAFGYGLSPVDLGDSAGTVIGGHKIAFSGPVNAAIASELAGEQRSHVEVLRQMIAATGRVPVSQSTIDFQAGFTQLAQLAGLVSANQVFDVFANDITFALGAYLLEDLGVTAYHFLLQQVVTRSYLDKLSGLLAAEAYHAGIIRATLLQAGFGDQTNALSYARDVLDLSVGTAFAANDHGVGTFTNPGLTNVDGNAIVASRTTSQVQQILFAGSGSKTGFFPQGIKSAP